MLKSNLLYNMKMFYRTLLLGGLLVLCGHSSVKQEKGNIDLLRQEFRFPNDSARTKLWWFHGETETTKEGITADLEAFKQAGIGGVVYYDQVHGKGADASPVFSKDWWEKLIFSVSEAKRLGLTFEVNVSNGYVAGGPWITKKLSMQKVVASDTVVSGNCQFSGRLPLPTSQSEFWDFAVIAFPVTGTVETSMSRKPELSSNMEGVPLESLFVENGKFVEMPRLLPGESVYIKMDFGSPFSARSFTYSANPRGKARTCAMNIPGHSSDQFYGAMYEALPDMGELEASDDGLHYKKVCKLKPVYQGVSTKCRQHTVTFPEVKSRFFRIHLHDWADSKNRYSKLLIGGLLLSSQEKVNNWEDKAGFNSDFIENEERSSLPSTDAINPADVIDLTKQVDGNGVLNWNVPQGEWMIMRFAHESQGGYTKHGRTGLKGLECDKMSAEAAIVQWKNYFKVIYDSLSVRGCPPSGMIMDSHEAGAQNWTPGFGQEFMKRKGYDIHPYLPALMGYVVGSAEISDRFLYDMRRTIADLISDRYYGTLDSLCLDAGIDFTAQAIGNALNIVGDNIQAKGRVQKPQGEFWAYQTHGSYDIKEASSAAHLYGKKVASAEAFTDAKFSHSLADLKSLADYALAFGSNEFVVCASAYQPWTDKIPGNTGGGRHYCLNRNNAYWNYSRPFWDYQARCAGLLRKGIPVIDLCVYLGDNPPVKLLSHRLPEIPEGYNFDVCTTDALINRTKALNGDIVLPDGMKYRMLVLQKDCNMTLAALRHIVTLVEQGVALYGERPAYPVSLAERVHDDEYDKMVASLWGSGKKDRGIRSLGKGHVYWGITLEEALQKEGIHPDIALKSGNEPENKVYFTHRHLPNIDIYFINNHSENVFSDFVHLRTGRKYAEYWDPVSGECYSLPVILGGNSLSLRLSLAARESGFIIVSDRKNDSLPARGFTTDKAKKCIVNGDWKVYFDPRWGGPGEVIFTQLTDWSKAKEPGIVYYSGTAVYKKNIHIDKKEKGKQILLRFDRLGSLARIYLNGHEVSTLWCSPWEADLTRWAVEGENSLEIHVVNSLMNRMIGDASLPQNERFTYAYPAIATSKDTLVPSGIIGNVYLVVR